MTRLHRPAAARLLIVVNELEFFLSHRLPVALAARDAGMQVHVATRASERAASLAALGLVHHAVPMSRSGMHPLEELRSLLALRRLMRELQPSLVHLVTIKPVLYGGIAARLAGVPAVVAAISGLGLVFSRQGLRASLLRGIVTALYRAALTQRRLRVIFQNPTDRDTLVGAGLVDAARTTMIPGSGVDLAQYAQAPEPDGVPCVLFAARLLKDKGVVEFVTAARQLRQEGCPARFLVAGTPDPGNPTSVTAADLARWKAEGDVELLGFRSDMASLLAACHVVALPSYYGEGLPKVLVEAAACGRAVVTTDFPGCRDAIEPDVSGLLVPPRDVPALAAALRRLVGDRGLRQRMGAAGRRLAEQRYAIEQIVAQHLRIYDELLASGAPGDMP